MAAEITLPRTAPGIRQARIVVQRPAETFELRARLRLLAEIALFLTLLALTLILGVVLSAYRDFGIVIDQQIAGGYLKSHAGLYASPRVIEKGARLTREQLATTLQVAGYARDRASNIWNGSFEVSDSEVRILPRQGSESHEWISVKFDPRGYVSALSANDRTDLPSYSLQPELLTPDASVKIGKQQNLTFQEIPPVMVQAILAIEDKRFFEHSGLDFWGIGRALLNFCSRGKLRPQQGGSTITQQLVKNVYLTPEKTLQRKFNEAIIAVALENRLSKQDIFALYCNEVYLGQRSGVGVRGVAQAAQVFFGKDLKDLNIDEAATIAGMIQSPARYAPDRNPEASKERRDRVIEAMIRDGAVNSDTGQAAQAAPVQVAAFESAGNETAPYYLDTVNRALESSTTNGEHDGEAEQSLRVQTTINPDLQAAAEHALLRQLDLLSKASSSKERPQGAMVALDPHTGHVLAMVGGRNYAESQLNRATDARRQPGSVFKPFVYAAALEAGISPLATYSDAPQTFQYGNATYAPGNFRESYSMHDVLMREGLVRSLNVVTVEVAMQTGLSRVANTAAQFGLPKPQPYPALALGTTEVTPLQAAAAYAVFANGGRVVEPTVVSGIVQENLPQVVDDTLPGMAGENLQLSTDAAPSSAQVISPTTAYMITDMLADVTERGTARRAKANFKDLAIAGKTGTSRDGWFVGYTPNLVCAVWIGYDDNSQLGLTGADAALPAWIDFVKDAIAIQPSLGGRSFPKPAGIITVRVDPETGFLAGPACPSSIVVNVASRFASAAECYKHRVDSYETLLSDTTESELLSDGPDAAAIERSTGEHSQTTLDLPDPVEPRVYSTPEARSGAVTQPTRKDVNQRARPTLVNDLMVVDPAPVDRGTKQR